MRIADSMTRIVATIRSGAVLIVAASVLAVPFAGVARAVVPPGLTNTANRPMQTQHAFKCQKLTNKNVAKYLAKWSKIYTKCVGAIATCVQTKASDSDCLAKAAAGCNASIANLGAFDTDKDAGSVLENTVTDFCGSLSTPEAFDDEGGPRFALIGDTCHSRFGFTPTYIQSYAGCLFEETNCVAESLLLFQEPRAHDLLDTAGVTIGHALNSTHSCLTNQNGSGALPDAKEGKAFLKCQKAITKAGSSFASKTRGAFAKCTDAVMNCAQLKPTQKCVDGAAKVCGKQLGGIDALQTKAEDAITKACVDLPLDDVLDVNGGAAGTLVALCNGLGVSPLTSVPAYATCLTREERCQIEDSITFTVPRITEFLTATGTLVSVPSSFCPAPSS